MHSDWLDANKKKDDVNSAAVPPTPPVAPQLASTDGFNNTEPHRRPAAITVGSVLAEHYRILQPLGSGGMSQVYKAQNLLTKRIVAVKLMHTHLLSDNNAVRRFQQEATAASRLQHQNCITIWDIGLTESSQPFLIMDYLEGHSLAEVLESSGALPVSRCLHIFKQACAALSAAHERGVVHRDLKPSNIMLVTHERDQDFVKVVDFGIAKILPDGTGNTPKLTATGDIFGSPLYMSPEQCSGTQMDARSDIYSLGCVMYETLTGNAPLLGNSLMETMYNQINVVPQGLHDIEADAATVAALNDVVLKSLAKKPSARQQTMTELAHDLERIEHKLARKFKLWSPLARLRLSLAPANTRLVNFVRRGGWVPISLFTTVSVVLVIAGIAYFVAMNSAPPPLEARRIPLVKVEETHIVISDAQVIASRGAVSGAHNVRLAGHIDIDQFYGLARAAETLRLAGLTNLAYSAFFQAILWSNDFKKSGRPIDFRSLGDLYAGAAKSLESEGINSLTVTDKHDLPKWADLAVYYYGQGDETVKEFLSLARDCRARQNLQESVSIQYEKMAKITDTDATELSKAGTPEMARALNQMGDYYCQFNPDEARAAYKFAAVLWKAQGANCNLAATYNQLGMLASRQAQFDSNTTTRTENLMKALDWFNLAEQALKDEPGEADQYLIGVYYNQADVYWKLHTYDKAVASEFNARRMQIERAKHAKAAE
ncbi:MAG TPA: serine/threonine-protein kinase [Planktothrix sp.]